MSDDIKKAFCSVAEKHVDRQGRLTPIELTELPKETDLKQASNHLMLITYYLFGVIRSNILNKEIQIILSNMLVNAQPPALKNITL